MTNKPTTRRMKMILKNNEQVAALVSIDTFLKTKGFFIDQNERAKILVEQISTFKDNQKERYGDNQKDS